MRRILFWLPIVLWLAVESYLLRIVWLDCGGLVGDCHGTDCSEVSALMGIWGLPSSLLVAYAYDALPIAGCSRAVSIAAALTFSAAGLIQWYYIMRGVESLLTKLYGWLRSMGRNTAG